jgi:ABC-type bacteriocin/lantibiotic exporter with double-glycine peptidase domain
MLEDRLKLDYLNRLLAFCIRQHPVILMNFVLAAFSVALELAAIASLMPLSQMAAGGELPPNGKWARLFATFDIQFTVTAAVLWFVVVFCLRLVSQLANQIIGVRIGKQVQAELSARAFERIVKYTGLREIDSKSAGHFISLAGDETARAGAVAIAISQFFEALLLACVYYLAMFFVSVWLGIGVAVFLAIVVVSLRGTLRRSQALSAKQLIEAKIAHSVFLDTLNGLRSVRAMSAEAFVTSKYDRIIRQYTRTHYGIDTLSFAAKAVPAIIMLMGIGTVAAAGYLEMGSATALSIVITALAFLLRFFPAAGQVLGLFMRILNDLRAASDVTHLLDEPEEVAVAGNLETLTGPIETVELRNVRFAYAPGLEVLRDFSMTLTRGRSYALVGPSGSGKTTLFDLLLGFYATEGGEILINGRPVAKLEPTQLKRRVVLVGQQVNILNDTVANNVRFGHESSDAQVRAACVAACIDADIMELPQGYDTVLNFQGSNLSGGQRQRIAIARGLLREPALLLLDESTTGLDSATRDRVIDNVLRACREFIVLFSTHDKEVMSRVDEVIRLTGRNLPPPADVRPPADALESVPFVASRTQS